MEENKQEPVKNPCIRKCTYNDNRICLSCFRSQKEVYEWGDYDENTKILILQKCNERKSEINVLPNKM